jgi:hypothetical protein
MNWFEAVPALLVTAAWLLVPGVAISYLVGLRGIAAWGLAPITSLAIIASTAVVLEMAGIDWSAIAVLRRRRVFASEPDPRAVTIAGFVGLLPGMVLGMITIVMAIQAPDVLNQTYDALFHYNALAYIQDSQQASR